MFFGAGHYYCVTLGADMISVVSEPEEIKVLDEHGNDVPTDDKPTVFKHNERYYLAYGNNYAISDHLKGPYRYIGPFVSGGHNDFFEYKGKYYVSYECADIGLFYRGFGIAEVSFNQEGHVICEEAVKPYKDMKINRIWKFDNAESGWFSTDYKEATYRDNAILLEGGTGVRSAALPGIDLEDGHVISLEMRSQENDVQVKVVVETVAHIPEFWLDEKPTKLHEFYLTVCTKRENYEIVLSGIGVAGAIFKNIQVHNEDLDLNVELYQVIV